jgi:hypothetical protein
VGTNLTTMAQVKVFTGDTLIQEIKFKVFLYCLDPNKDRDNNPIAHLVASVEFSIKYEIEVGAKAEDSKGRVTITQKPEIECPVGPENKKVLDNAQGKLINSGLKPK